MMRNLLAIILCAVLTGCATVDQNPGRVLDGPPTEAPWGYDDMCEREPWQRDCGGNGVNPLHPILIKPIGPSTQAPWGNTLELRIDPSIYYHNGTCTTGAPVVCSWQPNPIPYTPRMSDLVAP